MNSTTSLSILCVSLLAGNACSTKTGKEKNEKPNVIIFLADDLGYNDLSCYRDAHPDYSEQPPTCRTPRLDELADQGSRFTDYYCGAAVCSPSRAALLTGRNATRVGIYNWIPPKSPMHLRTDEVTIAEMLKDNGYQTAHFGKWHLTSEGMGQPIPNDQGFDYSFFSYNNAEPSHENPVNYHRNGEPVGEMEGYACHLVVDEAINWLNTKKDNHPFYINVWFNEPHEKVAAPDSLADNHEYNKDYYGCIENMDYAVGRLLDFIEENGWTKNTIVMFMSDNGSSKNHSNDPLRGAKVFNYEGGIRVPFIIRWPGYIPARMVNHNPGGFVDILPTLAEFTGARLPENKYLDGANQAKVFMGDTNEVTRKHPLFFYRYFHEPVCMLRDGRWCLLGYDELIPYSKELNVVELAKFKPAPGEPSWSQWGFQESHMEVIPAEVPKHFELYDLDKDIRQKNDLSAEYPEKVKEMKKLMLQLREEMIKEGGNWFE